MLKTGLLSSYSLCLNRLLKHARFGSLPFSCTSQSLGCYLPVSSHPHWYNDLLWPDFICPCPPLQANALSKWRSFLKMQIWRSFLKMQKELSKNADLITSFLQHKNSFIASYAFRIIWQCLRVIRGPCARSACYCFPPSLTFHHLHTFNSVCAAPFCAWAFVLAVSFAITYQYHLPLLWLILSFKSQLTCCLIQKPFLDSTDWSRHSFCEHTPLVLTIQSAEIESFPSFTGL